MTPSRAAQPPHPTTTLLRGRVRAFFREVPRGLAGEEEAIHQMRVMGRRLRVALPLLALRPDGRRLRRALRLLRDATRAAGVSRDLDVIAGLLATRALGAPASAELRLLLTRLRRARRRARAAMAERLLDLDIARLRRDLRRLLHLGAADAFSALTRLREQRESEGAALLAEIDGLAGRFDPVALHRLRRRIRRLRYAAELRDELRGAELGAARALKELQERLGDVHDAHVLAAWLGSRGDWAAAHGQQALAAEAERQRAHFESASRGLHRALLEDGFRVRVEAALSAMAPGRSVA
ncbi:MAG: CHAD domain-containing protein [Vicinamibacteria bacterium]